MVEGFLELWGTQFVMRWFVLLFDGLRLPLVFSLVHQFLLDASCSAFVVQARLPPAPPPSHTGGGQREIFF